jgi:hypothetical protein
MLLGPSESHPRIVTTEKEEWEFIACDLLLVKNILLRES